VNRLRLENCSWFILVVPHGTRLDRRSFFAGHYRLRTCDFHSAKVASVNSFGDGKWVIHKDTGTGRRAFFVARYSRRSIVRRLISSP
jgi:hypothetical protein